MPFDTHHAMRTAAAALVLACGAPTLAHAAGPFAAFAGNFHGGGAVIGSDGHRERISCRARASVGGGGTSMSQTIVCASDSYRINITSNVVASGGSVSGSWTETTRGVSGSIAGRASDGQFSGRVDGGTFAASVAMRATGRGLSLSLAPNGGDVARVEVSMSR